MKKNPQQAIKFRGSISLAAYFITVSKKMEKDSPRDVTNFDGSGASLPDILYEILKDLDYEEVLGGSRTIRTVLCKYDKAARLIDCTVMSGSFGRNFEVRELGAKKTAFKGETKHKQEQEFNFTIKFPTNKQFGYLIVQRNNNWGIRTTLWKAIKSLWDNSEFKIEIDPCAIKQVIDMYKAIDRATEITMIQHGIPANVFERTRMRVNRILGRKHGYEEKYGSIEVRIKSGRGAWMQGVAKAIFNNESPVPELVDILKIPNFNPTQTHFVLEGLNGKKKNFVLKGTSEPRTFLEITNDVVVDGDILRDAIFKEIYELIASLPMQK